MIIFQLVYSILGYTVLTVSFLDTYRTEIYTLKFIRRTCVEVFSKTVYCTSTVDGILESAHNSAQHRLFQWLIKSYVAIHAAIHAYVDSGLVHLFFGLQVMYWLSNCIFDVTTEQLVKFLKEAFPANPPCPS